MTSCIFHGLGICTLTNPSAGDVIYFLDRLHHPHLDWSVCKFQACDRYRKSRYSPHTSDVQYSDSTYFILLILFITPLSLFETLDHLFDHQLACVST